LTVLEFGHDKVAIRHFAEWTSLGSQATQTAVKKEAAKDS
jgi:hypothetical protein